MVLKFLNNFLSINGAR